MGRRPTAVQTTNDPALYLDLELRDHVFYFKLVNRADTVLRNVRIAFRGPLIGGGGSLDITKLALWQKLSFVAPGKIIEVPIDRADSFFVHNGAVIHAVSIQYADPKGTTWACTIKHNFSAYRNFPSLIVRPTTLN